MTAPDIIIVGAGVIGASSAWRLAAGGRRVMVVHDPSAAPATEFAAGMLAPVTEAEYGEEALLGLSVESSSMYRGFVEDLVAATGADVGYRRCGTVMVARDRDDSEALRAVHAFQQRLGLPTTKLSAKEIRAIEPTLSPRVRGGISSEGDHQIDPPALLRALRSAGTASGVEYRAARVRSVGRHSITLDDGEVLSCGVVVVTAGAYSGLIEGIDVQIPVRPVKGQLVHLRAREGAVIPTRNVRGLDVYIVARNDGRVVIGASVEEQGFDLTLTAGAVHDLLRYAYELVPGITELEYVGVTAGLRPATPDNAPIIGRLRDDLIVATGHYRNGVLLAPVTARLVTGLIEGRDDDLLEPFDPHRFVRQGALT